EEEEEEKIEQSSTGGKHEADKARNSTTNGMKDGKDQPKPRKSARGKNVAGESQRASLPKKKAKSRRKR
ncbi:MAG: hypothetical protein WD295_04005, partial [Bacteroidota bacterium]